jgi:asparagine synthase (glutamine-hydrolysing)
VDQRSQGAVPAELGAVLADMVTDPATARLPEAGWSPADIASWAEVRQSADVHRALRRLGHHMGVAVHAPFLDGAVVRAALAVPASRRADPRSSKPLLARALAETVPAAVFARRTKGDYTAEEYRGVRRSARTLLDLLSHSRLADLGVIEPGPVRDMVYRWLAGAPVPLGSLSQLIATELWLRESDCAARGGLSC